MSQRFLRVATGVAVTSLALAGCASVPRPAASAMAAGAPEASASLPMTEAIGSAPSIAAPTTDAQEAARVELDDGALRSTAGHVDLAGLRWSARGACDGAPSETIAYEVRVDEAVVSAGTITCAPAQITVNPAFSGLTGVHAVTVNFTSGTGSARNAYVVILPESRAIG